MRKFKFELGDIVSHITDENNYLKFVILGRYFLETNGGVNEKYICFAKECERTSHAEELKIVPENN